MSCKLLIIIGIVVVAIIFIIIYMSRPKRGYIQENLADSPIPSILYKTGPFTADDIPDEISDAINTSSKYLGCTVRYFDDVMCRDFIKNNFDQGIVDAYDSLIPTAYKADLWRYCVLWKNGGVYSDLSQTILIPFDINENGADMILTKDRSLPWKFPIQISFMATKPKNNFLFFLINNIARDIHKKRKGISALDITGPRAFGRYFRKYFATKTIDFGINQYVGKDNRLYIIDMPFYQANSASIKNLSNDTFIQMYTPNHKKLLYGSANGKNSCSETSPFSYGSDNIQVPHYNILWKQNKIYKSLTTESPGDSTNSDYKTKQPI